MQEIYRQAERLEQRGNMVNMLWVPSGEDFPMEREAKVEAQRAAGANRPPETPAHRLAPRRSYWHWHGSGSSTRSHASRGLDDTPKQSTGHYHDYTHVCSTIRSRDANRIARAAADRHGADQQLPTQDWSGRHRHVRLWTSTRDDGTFPISMHQLGHTARKHATSSTSEDGQPLILRGRKGSIRRAEMGDGP